MNERAKVPFWMPALIYGAIAGFAGILVSVIFYFLGVATANWTQWAGLLVLVIVMAYCLVAYRKEYLGGFASFGQLFRMALVIGIISTILGTIYSWLLFNVIDPELLEKTRLLAEERVLSNPRIPEGAEDEVMKRMEKNFQPGRMAINGLIFGTVLSAILGLLLAAFIKRERTPADPVA